MSLEKVSIPHRGLADALQSVITLNGTLGRDCWVDFESYSLDASLELIDTALIADLHQPPEVIAPIPPVQRIDRRLVLVQQQQLGLAAIEADYLEAYTRSVGDRTQQREAYSELRKRKRELRDIVVLPYVEIDVVLGKTLVYSTKPVELNGVEVIDFPDGRSRTIHTLIHYTHPATPEELSLRERDVTAERIIRYQVEGLDESEWERQNQPAQPLDIQEWRRMLSARFDN